jgi:hypothetical protein
VRGAASVPAIRAGPLYLVEFRQQDFGGHLLAFEGAAKIAHIPNGYSASELAGCREPPI